MSTTTSNLGLFKYDTTNPTDLASAFNIKTALNNNWDKIDEAISNSGGARNIGEIVTSTVPLTDAGLHLLDGALINGSGIYSEFVQYIASIYEADANYFCTEAQWQQSITDYGVCGKFVYNSTNNTVRLPKYNSKIYTGDGTAPVVGNGITLGMTDGTNNGGLQTNSSGTTGICLNIYGKNIGTAGGATYNNGVSFGVTTDTTKSGLIAQLSDITTSVDGYYYIVVATLTKTAIQVDIDTIATNLNSKVDKSDLQEVQCVVETYQNGTSWYRVYSDGWCEQGGFGGEGWTYFLKPFLNTNYTIITCAQGPNADAVYGTNIRNDRRFTDRFYPYYAGATITGAWYACGYIAVGE